jgi:hypothetical protein
MCRGSRFDTWRSSKTLQLFDMERDHRHGVANIVRKGRPQR